MMKAVAVHTTMVSTNTPRDWMRPCWTGWATVAVAAAKGAVPCPASLENRPRRVPLVRAAMMPPVTPPAKGTGPKAEEMIVTTSPGSWVMWRATMTTAMTT